MVESLGSYLPKGPMEASGREQNVVEPKTEIERVFGVKIPKAVEVYTRLLERDSKYLSRIELSQATEEELQDHLRQMRVLRTFLRDFADDPKRYIVRDQRVSQDESIYVARLRLATEGNIGVGLENAQTQFSMYTELRASPESRDTAIRFASLKGVNVERAARMADKEVNFGAVTINSVLLFRATPEGRVLAVPQAGVRISKVGEYIDIDGEKPVGASHFHHYEIPDQGDIDFTLDDYQVLQSVAIRLSGYTAAQPIDPRDLEAK